MDILALSKFVSTGLTCFTPENITDQCPICAVSYDDISARRNKKSSRLPAITISTVLVSKNG
jgi:hypothetical protein